MATNRQFTEFKPRIGADDKTARVYDVKYFCGRLWVAGDFTQRRWCQPHRAGQPQPDHRRGDQRGQPLIGGTASATAGPTRITKIAPSPNCKRVVLIGNFTQIANHVRYQVAVVNVSLDRRPGSAGGVVQPFHLRASQPGVGGTSACGGTALTVWPRDVDWAPDGTWWALAGDRRQHGRTRRCATR